MRRNGASIFPPLLCASQSTRGPVLRYGSDVRFLDLSCGFRGQPSVIRLPLKTTQRTYSRRSTLFVTDEGPACNTFFSDAAACRPVGTGSGASTVCVQGQPGVGTGPAPTRCAGRRDRFPLPDPLPDLSKKRKKLRGPCRKNTGPAQVSDADRHPRP